MSVWKIEPSHLFIARVTRGKPVPELRATLQDFKEQLEDHPLYQSEYADKNEAEHARIEMDKVMPFELNLFEFIKPEE